MSAFNRAGVTGQEDFCLIRARKTAINARHATGGQRLILPSPLPAQVRLKPVRRNNFALAAASFVFVLVGCGMIADGESNGWFVTLFFGLCLVVSILLMTGEGASLDIGPDGFSFGPVFRREMYRWDEIGAFDLIADDDFDRITFVHLPDGESRFAHIDPMLSGAALGLKTRDGLSPENLMRILRAYHALYAKRLDAPEPIR
jgi:hypothetical protein